MNEQPQLFTPVNLVYRSIINIVANDIESISAQTPIKYTKSSASLDRLGNVSTFKSIETLVNTNEPDFENKDGLDNNVQIKNKEHEENL
ncbi:29322_t:CDS:2 [Gigaspora margarita]|uniref:29322_t:CDS:1 n=1 Tax=Gigaspora margarita TaxID=4874 RepID=A0ABN7V6N0_GIGMA|nr:29322_t:CDS:2 [Gigaspora margarita]